jgi:hypothetical protein
MGEWIFFYQEVAMKEIFTLPAFENGSKTHTVRLLYVFLFTFMLAITVMIPLIGTVDALSVLLYLT